jgi:acetylornithine deacetylase/succinyl-diaminopimelate desuccinylase-like protein
VLTLAVGEKGTLPVRVSAVGEAGHASMPTLGDNAVPLLGELLTRVGRGLPTVEPSSLLAQTLGVLLPDGPDDLAAALEAALPLHPTFVHSLPRLDGARLPNPAGRNRRVRRAGRAVAAR